MEELTTPFGALILDNDVVYAVHTRGADYAHVHFYCPETADESAKNCFFVLNDVQLTALSEFFANVKKDLVERIRKDG